MHRRADAGEQGEARGALGRIGIVDGDGVEEGVDRGAQARERRHRPLEILVRHRGGGGGLGRIKGGDQVSFGLFGRVGKCFRGAVGGAVGIGGLAFLLEDVGGALVAGEQVRAVVGRDERLQRADAGEQADEVVLAAEREHRVDQIVTDAGLALLDFEAVGEEGE